MSVVTDSKPIVKATDMEPEEAEKVLELVDAGLKLSLK